MYKKIFSLRIFLLSILEHILSLYENAPIHKESDYSLRVGGEELTKVFPNFPLWRERARYNIDCERQDLKSSKDSCEKDFPSHAMLTPGLYLMTCGCSYKSIYGFSLMLTGESPKMLFDIIMTRFEPGYNPFIIYDASCKVHSFFIQFLYQVIFYVFTGKRIWIQ